MQVFVHIGFPKTGSTAIQSHLFANQGWFEARGVLIPQTGYSGGKGHSLLSAHAFGPQRAPEARDHMLQLFGELSAEIEAGASQGFRRALISCEGFAVVDEDTVAQLGAALSSHEIVLLAYVRDQVSLLQSSLLQQMEAPGLGMAPLLFDSGTIRNESARGRLRNYDFTACLTRWRNVIGAQLDIRVRQYERQLLQQADVVIDFVEWLGLAVNDAFALQEANVNHSIDATGAALLLVALRAGVRGSALQTLRRGLLSMELKAPAMTRQFFSNVDVAYLRDYYRDSNRQLFTDFRPQNVAPDAVDFTPSVATVVGQARQPSSFEFLRRLYTAVDDETLPVWEGESLIGHRLSAITRGRSRGWRVTEVDGVWSSGHRSSISFRPPATSASYGPVALELHVAGVYADGQTQSRVIVGDTAQDRDLSRDCIAIPMEQVRREGVVEIVLQHAVADAEASAAGGPGEPAFKLRRAYYRFVWEGGSQ